MDYLIVGGAGFIGSRIAQKLVDDGERVRVLDSFETGREENLSAVDGQVAVVEGDICDEQAVRRAVAGVDCIFHQAALPSVPRSISDPIDVTETNCLGTTTLLTAAKDADVETVVVASSSSVYGPSESLPKREAMPVDPASPYALSKYWTEQLAVQYSDYFDLDTVALRYFNVFGPRQDPSGEYAAVIPTFIDRMLDGKPPVIYGDGEQSRDFTYIDNVVQANVKAAESDCTGRALNVACGRRITLNELVDHLNDILGTELEPKYTDPRPGDVRHSQADISNARELLEYEPTVSFREGLERTVEWFESNRAATGD